MSALRPVPGEVPPADACPTSGRGPGTGEKRALGSPGNFGGCVGVGRSGRFSGSGSERLKRGAGAGRRGSCLLLRERDQRRGL